MPTNPSTFSMPFSAMVAWSALSDEKAIAAPALKSSPLPSSIRSLSFAVTIATLRPAFWKRGQDRRRAQEVRIVHHHFRVWPRGRRRSSLRCRVPIHEPKFVSRAANRLLFSMSAWLASRPTGSALRGWTSIHETRTHIRHCDALHPRQPRPDQTVSRYVIVHCVPP